MITPEAAVAIVIVLLGLLMMGWLLVMVNESRKAKNHAFRRFSEFPPPPPRPMPTKSDLENKQAREEWKAKWDAYNAKYPS
ncbi:hypothetical protein [Hymenobacter wooponensis]|uniref:Uncharacterized protein n=1 Tax=Hymenobacter wooponensis TaxID=1525360 RepID=A0A4Z0MUD2_9BACT|nr:hypothetical protein [Hymenobacter wooponensis]TGD82867.1 hypothetical protein EU557_03545 [Hymenobacter wooponensis]